LRGGRHRLRLADHSLGSGRVTPPFELCGAPSLAHRWQAAPHARRPAPRNPPASTQLPLPSR
jgi:hypothetical protein